MRNQPSEDDPGRQPSRLLIGLILPFYIAWAGIRAIGRGARSLLQLAGRGLQRIGRLIDTAIAGLAGRLAAAGAVIGRALGAVLRPIVGAVGQVIGAMIRTVRIPIHAALRAIGGIAAALWRGLRALLVAIRPAIDRLGVVFAVVFTRLGRGLAYAVRGTWRGMTLLRDLGVLPLRLAAVGLAAIGAGVDRRIRPVVVAAGSIVSAAFRGLSSAASAVARQVGRAVRALGRPLMAVARPVIIAIRAAGAAIARIARAVRAFLGSIRRGIAGALYPVISAVRRAGATVRRAFAPVSRAFAIVRETTVDARDAARAALGLAPRSTRPPTGRATADGPTVTPALQEPGPLHRQPGAHRIAVAGESARMNARTQAHPRLDEAAPAPRRPRRLGAVALSVAVVMFLVAAIDEILAIPGSSDDFLFVVAGALLAGLIAPVTRSFDAIIGFTIGTAAVILVAAAIDTVTGRINPTPPFVGWLGLMVVGLLPFVVGCVAGSALRGRPAGRPRAPSDRGPTAVA
jgi:hypothetical protein